MKYDPGNELSVKVFQMSKFFTVLNNSDMYCNDIFFIHLVNSRDRCSCYSKKCTRNVHIPAHIGPTQCLECLFLSRSLWVGMQGIWICFFEFAVDGRNDQRKQRSYSLKDIKTIVNDGKKAETYSTMNKKQLAVYFVCYYFFVQQSDIFCAYFWREFSILNVRPE